MARAESPVALVVLDLGALVGTLVSQDVTAEPAKKVSSVLQVSLEFQGNAAKEALQVQSVNQVFQVTPDSADPRVAGAK